MTTASGWSEDARAWAEALQAWAIPAEILAAAPENPWAFPVDLFRVDPTQPPPATPSRARAVEALGDGGEVLDVGCGGGAASVPLAGTATALVGVDRDPAMLRSFESATAAAGVAFRSVEGEWPAVAERTPVADVAVCHHVVYNVADIAPFLTALAAHARRRVVIELTARHPQSPLNPLWKRFWGLDRPTEPTAALLIQIVRDLGFRPTAETFERPVRRAALDRRAYVAFVRRRLCLGPERDRDIEAVLGDPTALTVTELVTVSWDP